MRPIEWLLGTGGLPEFSKTYWGRSYWFGAGRGRSDLFSLSEFSGILSQQTPYLLHAVRLSQARSAEDDNRSHLVLANEPLEAVRALSACQSITLNRLERFLPQNHPLTALHTDLCHLVGVGIDGLQIAAFHSPPGGRAFGRHIDRNDIFILQVAGEKIWEVESAKDANLKIPMRPGDVLYLPYAMPHAVRGTGETSLSLTFIMRTPTWRDLAIEAMISRLDCSGHPLLERPAAMPFGWLEHLDLSFAEAMGEAFDPLLTAVGLSAGEAAAAARRIGLQHLPSMPVSPDVVAAGLHAPHLEAETWLRPAWSPPLVRIDNLDHLVISAPGLPQLSVAGSYLMAIEYMAETAKPFQVKNFPDVYAAAAKAHIAKRLVESGYMRVTSG